LVLKPFTVLIAKSAGPLYIGQGFLPRVFFLEGFVNSPYSRGGREFVPRLFARWAMGLNLVKLFPSSYLSGKLSGESGSGATWLLVVLSTGTDGMLG
jgi:hypothetical protein